MRAFRFAPRILLVISQKEMFMLDYKLKLVKFNRMNTKCISKLIVDIRYL